MSTPGVVVVLGRVVEGRQAHNTMFVGVKLVEVGVQLEQASWDASERHVRKANLLLGLDIEVASSICSAPKHEHSFLLARTEHLLRRPAKRNRMWRESLIRARVGPRRTNLSSSGASVEVQGVVDQHWTALFAGVQRVVDCIVRQQPVSAEKKKMMIIQTRRRLFPKTFPSRFRPRAE